METPNMRVHDLNMEMGLKFKHTMFDPDKVDIMSLLKLIPPAWEEMMKLLPGNENEKGMVTLLTEAMETQPLKDLPNPLGFDWVDEAKVWSLKSQLNAALKLLLPKKKEFEFDVGKMISKGMDKYKFTKAAKKLVMKDPEKCTGDDPQCIFIFPKMFKPRDKNDANGVGSNLFLDPNTTDFKHVLTFHSLLLFSSFIFFFIVIFSIRSLDNT